MLKTSQTSAQDQNRKINYHHIQNLFAEFITHESSWLSLLSLPVLESFSSTTQNIPLARHQKKRNNYINSSLLSPNPTPKKEKNR